MKRTLLSTLVVTLLLAGRCVGTAEGASATSLKPLVTVSFAGYDELLAGIDFLGEISDAPGLGQQLEGMLKLMTQNKGLAGLDTQRPWGAVIQTDGGQDFPVYGFIPVSDLKELMTVIREMQMAPIPEEEPADGVYELEMGGPAICIQQKGNWAFIAASREALSQVPADPTGLLGDLPKKYDLAVNAKVQNVPAQLRTVFMAELEAGMEQGMEQLPGESEADYLMRTKAAEQAIQMIKDAVNDLDEVLIGCKLDRSAKTAYMDLQVSAVPGSETASQLSGAGAATSRFAGFALPGAALTINSVGELSEADVATMKSSLKDLQTAMVQQLGSQGLSEAQEQLAEQVLADLIDVIDKTAEGKVMDAGMSLTLKPDALTFVMGAGIELGDKLEVVLKQVVGEATKAEPEAARYFKLDSGNLGNVRLHTVSIPTAETGDETATQLFGESLDVIVGITNNSLYVAAGRDALPTLEKAIEASKAQANTKIPPGRIAIAGSPIAQFVATMAPDEESQQIAGMVAAMLQQAAGKDHLTVTTTAVANGGRVRIELEEGLLKAIGTGAQMAGAELPIGIGAAE